MNDTEQTAWCSKHVLGAAFAAVARRTDAAGLDGIRPAAYREQLDEHLQRLADRLQDGTYRPKPLLKIRKQKPDGRFRRLAILSVEDRVAVEAIRWVVEPKIEARLSRCAYAYRPNRSALDAVETVGNAVRGGERWVVVADIAEFFDSIPHRLLVETLPTLGLPKSCEGAVRALLRGHPTRPKVGIPQGSPLSPALSNLALASVDALLETLGHTAVRYCDNICIVAATKGEAETALDRLRNEIRRLGLRLKDAETRVVSVAEGFVWLGFVIDGQGKRVATGALESLRDRAERLGAGTSDSAVLKERLLPLIRGFMQYYQAPLPQQADLGKHRDILLSISREVTGEPAKESGPPAVAWPEAEPPWEMDADDEEWETESVSEDAHALLTQAEQWAARGEFERAEQCFERAKEVMSQKEEEESEPEPEQEWDEERLDGFLALFCARQSGFDTAAGSDAGIREYTWVPRPPGPQDIRDHLAGRVGLAVRPRLLDGSAVLGVIDVDPASEDARVGAMAYAEAVSRVASTWGLPVLVEDTGGRGVHVWFPLDGAVEADKLAAALAFLTTAAGTPAAGVRVEILPGSDRATDMTNQAMALPCGVHTGTGRRSRLRWFGGPDIGEDLAGIFAESPIRVSQLERVVAPEPRTEPVLVGIPMATSADFRGFGSAVHKVMSQCHVLRYLAEKAAAVGHLTHAERLSLLYTLGFLETGGRQAIHHIIGKCHNYDARETERQIARRTELPIRCARLVEKHPLPEGFGPCRCPAANAGRGFAYATPLLFASGFKQSWREVLRGRKERAVPTPVPGVAVVLESEPERLPLPPHRWA